MKHGPTGQHDITGRKRERVFAYTRYLAILNEGTETLRSRKQARRSRLDAIICLPKYRRGQVADSPEELSYGR